uniref:Uncharacterized protein n=1 Tax=Rousettus aegyptiacus TaxID=9407 RepID=A0A7J8IMS2_ROUAE|nr:hypothetical protein HJG63_010651 [Rousettus aegyptiacus]
MSVSAGWLIQTGAAEMLRGAKGGGFLFEGLSDDEDDFHPSARSTPSSSTPSSRPASLGYSGAAGPRPITQSELATALALASTPESSSHTPTPGTQVWTEGGRGSPAVEWVCPC